MSASIAEETFVGWEDCDVTQIPFNNRTDDSFTPSYMLSSESVLEYVCSGN